MALPDWAQTTGFATLGGIGLRMLWQEVRERRKDWKADQSESAAIRNLKDEMQRQSARIDSLEKKLDEREAEFEAERTLRRMAEDALDKEKRRSAALEDRIVELERDFAKD